MFVLLSPYWTAHWTERQPAGETASPWRTTRSDTDSRQVHAARVGRGFIKQNIKSVQRWTEVGLLPMSGEHAPPDRHRSQSEQISGTFIEARNLTRKVSHNSHNAAAASPGDGFPPPPPLITSFSGRIAHLLHSGFPISHCYVSLGHRLV